MVPFASSAAGSRSITKAITGLCLLVALTAGHCGRGLDTNGPGGLSANVPLALSYGSQAFVLPSHLGASVAPSTFSGTAATVSISPELPGGLTIDPTTGVISGTPVRAAHIPPAPTGYTVTATRGSESVSAQVLIQVTPTWQVTTIATGMVNPVDVFAFVPVSGPSDIYIVDQGESVVRKITGGTGSAAIFAGTLNSGGTTDGGVASGHMSTPAGIFWNPQAGNFLEMDNGSSAVRTISLAGVLATPSVGGVLTSIQKVVCTTGGTAFVSNFGKHTIVELNTTVGPYGVSVFAGTDGNQGSATGVPTVGQLFNPLGVALDDLTSPTVLYIADSGNHAIRKVLFSSGSLTNFAGTPGGGSGYVNASGLAAQFNAPAGIATDSDGNIFVADGGNHAIRMITPAGVVTTIAGQLPDGGGRGTPGSTDGLGTAAFFNSPGGVTVDRQTGDLYVADTTNGSVRKIVP